MGHFSVEIYAFPGQLSVKINIDVLILLQIDYNYRCYR